MKIFGTLLALSLFILSQSANAGSGYVGVGIGQPKTNDRFWPLEASDLGFKLFVGYDFTNYIAIELGYINNGEPETVISGFTVSTQVHGVNFALVGRIPVTTSFYLYGKYGMYSWNEDGLINNIKVFNETGTDSTYGLGIQYYVTNTVSLRLEHEDYSINDSAGTVDLSMDSLSIRMDF